MALSPWNQRKVGAGGSHWASQVRTTRSPDLTARGSGCEVITGRAAWGGGGGGGSHVSSVGGAGGGVA